MLCERALWKTKLLKKSPFTLINCIKLFIFPSRSGLVERTMEEKSEIKWKECAVETRFRFGSERRRINGFLPSGVFFFGMDV